MLLGDEIRGSAITGADGRYTITDQVPGTGYRVIFRNPIGNAIFTTPFNQSSLVGGQSITQNGNPSTGTTTFIAGTFASGGIGGVTLYAGDNVQEQNLPIDPAGIVYDSVTRKPVSATITLLGPNGLPVPDTSLVIALNNTSSMTTGNDGVYQFLLTPSAPAFARPQITGPGPRPSS